MKIKIDAKELINEQRKTGKLCVEQLGKGQYSVRELKRIIITLEMTNQKLMKNCSTTTTIKTTSCGGGTAQLEESAISQGKLFKDNRALALALTMQIEIAETNNLKHVVDFSFTDEQILNYGQKKNIIY